MATMNESPQSPENQAGFYQIITETLYNVLRQDGGEWASPEQVDEVLDTINHFEAKRVKVLESVK
ncbi:hypothetical protein [Fibrella forsythiae]|uniref:Uncharacterized protein n=1 Tax=Fibrella forsythiae TaxID=2817061 RepID=A0ABS3JB61_9BACT|nr:hypothetical protein [Fibrella forsythiae]MBO0947227.1 hypothetical protein [Fibrella forsythiae]